MTTPSYTDLSDEDLINIAINFLSAELELPEDIVTRLKALGMYDLIVYPLEDLFDDQED